MTFIAIFLIPSALLLEGKRSKTKTHIKRYRVLMAKTPKKQ